MYSMPCHCRKTSYPIFTYGHLPKQSQTSWRDAEISEELLNSSMAFSLLDIDGGLLH